METGEHVPIHTQPGLDAAADAPPSVHCIIFGGIPRGEHSFPDTSITYSNWGVYMEVQSAAPAAPGRLKPGDASSAGTWPRSHSTPGLLHVSVSVVVGTPSLGDAHAGGR